MRSRILTTLAWLPTAALAEGTAELGPAQQLQSTTDLRVEVTDYSSQTLRWEGTGDVILRDPDGNFAGRWAPGVSAPVPINGVWTLDLQTEQLPSAPVDVVLEGAASPVGHVYSHQWRMAERSYDPALALHTRFFAVTPTGGSEQATIEVRIEGWSGQHYVISASAEGVPGAAGRSFLDPADDHSAQVDLPLYLNPPAGPSGLVDTPDVGAAAVQGPASNGQVCAVAPVGDGARFTWDSDTVGTAHVVCDLDGDGILDPTSDADLHLTADAGDGVLTWDGRSTTGEVVSAGLYTCVVKVAVGEVHIVATDIETSFEGLRLFQVLPDGRRASLPMFFNDSAVQGAAVTMPVGEVGLVRSGPEGLASGDPSQPAQANINARSWGNFGARGKGNDTHLDTWTWLDVADSPLFDLRVVELDADSDGDGLSDLDETCQHGSDPTTMDTDGDALTDGEEVALGTDPTVADSDGDALDDGIEVVEGTDPRVADSDGDGLGDGAEVALGTDPWDSDTDGDGLVDGMELDTDPLSDDTDGDGLGDGDEVAGGTDPTSVDTDGDGLLDGAERLVHNSDPTLADTDGDGLDDDDEVFVYGTDPTSVDTDGDRLADGDEVDVFGTDPTRADTDGDGLEDGDEIQLHGSDPGRVDTDGDGLSDGDEVTLHGSDPTRTDSDADGLDDQAELGLGTDPGLADSDGDGLLDGAEVDLHGTDPSLFDTDGDGLSDGLEVGTTGTDPLAADSDRDGLLDGDELDMGTDPTRIDTDGDGLADGDELVGGTDPTLSDSDDDGLSDLEELDDHGTDPMVSDTDGDGLSDGDEVLVHGTDPTLDDSDGDEVSDGVEILVDETDPLDEFDHGKIVETDVTRGPPGIRGGCGCDSGRGTGGWFALVALLLVRRRRAAPGITFPAPEVAESDDT